MSNLETIILQHFNQPDFLPWFPGLGQKIAEEKWKALEKQRGINKDNYSTEAYIKSKTNVGFYSLIDVLQNQIPLFPVPLCLALNDKSIDSYSLCELQRFPIIECIENAFEVLKIERSVVDTIIALVRNIHLLKLEDNEYDVSYSLPHIPFSIFVSIPSQRINNDNLRVAEAILHETMHLQLTLIEEIIPLVKQSNQKYFSPWKNEYRDSRGIIHALYVFKVIKEFIRKILIEESIQLNRDFLLKREEEIDKQLILLNSFWESETLTEPGMLLAKSLIRLT